MFETIRRLPIEEVSKDRIVSLEFELLNMYLLRVGAKLTQSRMAEVAGILRKWPAFNSEKARKVMKGLIKERVMGTNIVERTPIEFSYSANIDEILRLLSNSNNYERKERASFK
jgi:hypothetical protein